jgi:preprotein translocase subunit YajC
MKENDKLPVIISVIATIIFVVFLFIISRPTKENELQGGDIEKAIQTEQYR